MNTPISAEQRAPLSVLDLALVSDGDTAADALAQTTQTAREADRLGFNRFWVAEHHNMPTVASTSPAVLMAHLGANTERIHLGSGGVMLPNHAPLAVAEQFAMLQSLYPGRIDLGIGRAPGTDRATALALRGGRASTSDDDFPSNLIDLLGYLGDRRRDTGPWLHLAPAPDVSGPPEVFLLGSSDFSAQLAAHLGLAFAFAHHFDMGGTVEAVELYRSRFEPSAVLSRPKTLVTATVLAAPDGAEARRRAAPGRLRRLGLRSGRLYPLMTPEQAMADPAYQAAEAMTSNDIVGDPDEAAKQLELLIDRTGADEIMLFTSAHSLDDRLESHRLIAEAWGCVPSAGASV